MKFARIWPRPATALSLLGHAAFLALLAIEAPRHIAVVKQPLAPIDVVMVAPAEKQPVPAANPPPAAAIQPETASRPSPPLRAARPSTNGRVTATEYFADAVLDDPRNRGTRQKLASLGSDERLIQLCNIEAMEQLKRWKAGFVPDHVVAYAMADPSLMKTSIKAPGAAVHADGKWYRLSFNCAATADFGGVASFAFTLGSPIPPGEWEQHDLPELVDGDTTD
ncbi:DUF930 domain-containing protein [Pleomorphomonas sp. PLEO]|uniref:DUF930 domain-containing protein n=1 Tax=Pleomorphomonas sp. PLEO TaxID=3239306 RepID=UPI00351EEFB9